MNEERPTSPANEEDRLSFSLSENEADTADSLDIKPPQAVALHRKPNRHKKEKISSRDSKDVYRKSSHSRTDDRRKDYKGERSQRDRDPYAKESLRRPDHKERKERDRGDRDHGRRKEVSGHREERPDKRSQREAASYSRQENNQLLEEDLRGKLLEKRNAREANAEIEPDRKRRRNRDRSEKEKQQEPPPETEKERAERLEREERRAKLLEAEREMALRKEVSRRELEARRERHNLEKEKHRMLKEIARKHKLDKQADPKSEGEEGEIAEKSEEDDSDDDSESSTSTSTSDVTTENEDTEEEAKAKTPDSAPPLEKSPRTPEGRHESRSLSPLQSRSHEVTPERDDEPMEVGSHADEEEMPESPKDDPLNALPPYLPAISGCRPVEEFQCLNRIEEGTYGVVYRARDKRTQDIVALKRLKMEKEREGFPITSLREINTLLKAQHPNIVTVREIVVGSNMDKIFIVMDYVEHDLKSLMETMKSKKQVFVPGEVKCLMLQLLRAVSHLHDNWILHRDLKTSNLLLSHKGVLKVGDFGLAREYGSPLKAYTPIVVTLWYRAPELLLQTKEYSTAIDVWSVGCIFGELLQMEALFPGRSEMDQLNKIFKELGTPSEKVWPGISKLPAYQKVPFAEYPFNQIRSRFGTMLSDLGINLIKGLLTYDPTQRLSADAALKHDYFKEVPLPIDPAMFPTWPAKSEGGVKKVNDSPKPPSGGKAYKQMMDADEVPSGGFHMGAGERRINTMAPGFSLKF